MSAVSGSGVEILMATRNGADHIAEQLASIAGQTHPDWSLVVSDDGSSDATADLVARFASGVPGRRVSLRAGPSRGSTANFLSLLAGPGAAPFTALADQDDIWLPDKLSRAVAQLGPCGPAPALYGARTIIVDGAGRRLGLSPRFRRRPGFPNALVQSFAGGNTMVLNSAARRLAAEAAGRLACLPACHDWWLYQIVAGAGGRVLYDPVPVLLYRQHGRNQIGANLGPRAALRRIRLGLAGQFRRWSDQNLAALQTSAQILSDDARRLLDEFARIRQRRGPAAALALRRAGLHRQTLRGDLTLALAAVLGKL